MTEYNHRPVTVEDKTAVVIGGTSGIGEAIALSFAESGADVVASSRDQKRVSDTADSIRERGAETVEITSDITDRDSLRALRDETLFTFGSVDILVTSASAVSRSSLETITESEWADVFDVQLDGVYRAVQEFTREMDSGSIINISSISARLAAANLLAYSAAKGGTNSFVRAAAKELAPDIRVNAIAPGFVITNQNEDEYAEGTEKRARIEERTLLNRVADREEIAGAALYLASDAASYTTGEIITVDGGFSNNVF
jgi:NAD(P)-dependent dehydrogenase (short-subunit alcohol dehydrogenase family)